MIVRREHDHPPNNAMCRVSDQLSDGLIFGRLFQANEKFSTFRFAIEGTGNVHYAFSDSVTRLYEYSYHIVVL